MSELNIVHNGSALNPVHRSIKANRRLNGRDLLRFKLEQRGSGDPGLDVGDEIGLYLGSTFTDPNLLFAGTVDRISQTDENLQPGSQHYRTFQYEVADFNQVTDRFLVAESYSSQTLGAIVTDIVTTYLSGESVTTNNVTTGPTIERAVFPYVSVRDVFDELSERTGYIWWIDATKDLHFVNRTSNDAPFDLTSSNQPFQSLTVERNRSQYRNRQLVRAGQDLTDQRTESFDGDGQTRTFVTGFPVGEAPTIDVDGTSKTVGIRGVDQGKDFYWQKESNQITQDDGDAPLVSGDTLNIT